MQEKNDQLRQGTLVKKKSPKKSIEFEDIQSHNKNSQEGPLPLTIQRSPSKRKVINKKFK